MKSLHSENARAPYPETDVEQLAQEVTPKVIAHWTRLHAIVERHELLIHHLWRKKTKMKRRELLLSAWPNMPEVHRPASFTKRGSFRDGRERDFVDASNWPYINLEDLVEPKALLLFINARARNHPHTFALTELDFVASVTLPIPVSSRGPKSKMRLNGPTDSGSYGTIIEFPHEALAAGFENTRKGLSVADGIKVLWIQERILRFLVEYYERILHDRPAESLTSEDSPVQPEPPRLLTH